MSRSTLDSTPVLSSVVMASVAMLRLASLMQCSRSTRHGLTSSRVACTTTSLSVLTAAKRWAGMTEVSISCMTLMAGTSCCAVSRWSSRTNAARRLVHDNVVLGMQAVCHRYLSSSAWMAPAALALLALRWRRQQQRGDDADVQQLRHGRLTGNGLGEWRASPVTTLD